jgi:hypothetical protein
MRAPARGARVRRPGRAEVDQLHAAAPEQHHVAGPHVPVNQLHRPDGSHHRPVHVRQGQRHLGRHVDRHVHRHPAPRKRQRVQQLGQAAPVEVLEREVQRPGHVAVVLGPDHVGVVQLHQHLDLVRQLAGRIQRRVQLGAHDLQGVGPRRHRFAAGGALGPVQLRALAPADQLEQAVAAQAAAPANARGDLLLP